MTWESGSRTVGPVATPDPSLSRGQQTQVRLLEAAVEVLETKGYHAARVDDIVKAARTSHGTFYLYFANKEALFRQLIEAVAAEFDQLAARLPRLDASAESQRLFETWIGEFAEIYHHRSSVVRAWTEIAVPGDPAAALGRSVLAGFVVALSEQVRVANPSCTPAAAGLVATTIVAMIERTNYYLLTGHLRNEPVDVSRSLAHATRAIITAGAP